MNQLRRQLGKYVGKNVTVRPEGDSNNSLTGMLRREDGNGNLRPGFYLGLMQVPSTKIFSAAPRGDVLDIELSPGYFESNKHMAAFS